MLQSLRNLSIEYFIRLEQEVLSAGESLLDVRCSANFPIQFFSNWTVEEMSSLGFKVVGMMGLKPLRGEFGEIKWKPKLFWHRVSVLTQPLVRNHPSLAFQLLCIKNL